MISDHIAIPGFGGAMENWGLVTYQESAFLYNDTHDTLGDQRGVAFFIAHELAHMVSLRNILLNEPLQSFMIIATIGGSVKPNIVAMSKYIRRVIPAC